MKKNIFMKRKGQDQDQSISISEAPFKCRIYFYRLLTKVIILVQIDAQ